MQNSTSLQPSNHNVSAMKLYMLNTGFTFMSGPAESQLITQETVAKSRECLKRGAGLINMPFGQLEYQSRRRGSFLEFATADRKLPITDINAVFCECAVSSQGANHQFWNEFFARYQELRKNKLTIEHPQKNMEAPPPEAGPWFATCIRIGALQLTEQHLAQVLVIQLNIAHAFILDSVTKSRANSGFGSRRSTNR